MRVTVGTAGWTIPRDVVQDFPAEGSSLERYAARFAAAEINSSFHRSHRRSTWERWRDSVPDTFRFSAKLPKTITHQHKLSDCEDLLEAFVAEAAVLGDKLAILLVQLPPKLAFEPDVAGCFFEHMKALTPASIACEPRHASWFAAEADALLISNQVARVAADPAICDAAARPGGFGALSYWRLHGSPVTYRSSYRDRIDAIAGELMQAGGDCWCIFDNTASSAAAADALAVLARMGSEAR